MRGFGSSLEQVSNKLLSTKAAVEVVKPGHRVFAGTACATPLTLVEWSPFGSSGNHPIATAASSSGRTCARSFTLERRKPIPPDVELFTFPNVWFATRPTKPAQYLRSVL